MDPQLARAAEALREARRILVVTGAGVSTESGIPDFRSPGGLWTRFDPSEFHYGRFLADPVRFWGLRAQLMAHLDLDRVEPNAAHVALARLSRSSRLLGHVTQNIDGLFQRAGHDEAKLLEAHGSAATVRCIGCLAFFPYEVARRAVEAGRLPPHCPECHDVLKPGTVLFGEALPEERLRQAEQWARHADALLVVGTSLTVHPVAALPAEALDRGARLVLVNESSTPYDEHADVVLRDRAGAILPALLARAGLVVADGAR